MASKNLVICMDGTWNDPTEKTNVFKLFQMLPGEANSVYENGPIRSHVLKKADGLCAIYLEGVGANGRSQGVLQGSLGIGLHDRVIDAFILLSQRYKTGDKIWILGFSRGSWSARSLAGFVTTAGLLESAHTADAAQRAEQLWVEFKSKRTGARGDSFWKERDEQPIKLVGVWDTVGALGIPFFNGIRAIDQVERRLFDFADTNLSERVQFGLHALAIDETRVDFSPTPWTERAGIKQVWFAGVHADIGGGYPETGLSDAALHWMVEQINALESGIHLDTAILSPDFQPDPLANRHDEASKGVWQVRPREPRRIPGNAELHDSVLKRLAGRSDYRPQALRNVSACENFVGNNVATTEALFQSGAKPLNEPLKLGESRNVTVFAQNWWNASGICLNIGDQYEISATGKWIDRTNSTSAEGYPSSSIALKLFEGSRRVEKAPWFALIAAVHSDSGLEGNNPDSGNFMLGIFESIREGVSNIDDKSQLVSIGCNGLLTPNTSGYLYFFANDAPFAYSNNSGYLTVKITRTK